MINLFNRVGMPNFYKVDKITYSRGDISDLANRLTKKLDDMDHLIDYERRKNDVTNREKLTLQNQVNNLTAQLRKDETDRIKVRKQVQRESVLTQKLTECLCALKDSMIFNYLCLDFYKDVQGYVQANQYTLG